MTYKIMTVNSPKHKIDIFPSKYFKFRLPKKCIIDFEKWVEVTYCTLLLFMFSLATIQCEKWCVEYYTFKFPQNSLAQLIKSINFVRAVY